MARYLYCEPCGEIACGGAAVTFSNGSGEDAERSAWGTLLAPEVETTRLVTKEPLPKTRAEAFELLARGKSYPVTIKEHSKTIEFECNACGGMLAPGDRVCAYSLGTEPAWESRYLEIMDAA